MKFSEFLEEKKKVFKGEPPETGGTSIKGKGAAPAIRDLFSKGNIKQGMKVLDYGGGKFARNADFLRENGVECYAYDPFNGTESDGWEIGNVSSKLPKEKFDLGFTSFVLNVVPDHIKDQIISNVKSLCKESWHVTRNMDIFDTIKKSLHKKDKLVSDFFLKEFADKNQKEDFEKGDLTDDTILDFCYFGTITSRGFQRIPLLEDKGFTLKRKTRSFKVYN